MDDVFFIRNIDDYNVYNSLTPKKEYARKKVKFVCSKCNKESLKTFRYLGKDLVCRSCTCSEVHSTEEVKIKTSTTNIKRYGVTNVFQVESVKEKIKTTNIKKYGVENPHKNQEVINKTKETNGKIYGTDAPAQNTDILLKMQATTLERYGVNNVMQDEKIKEKCKDSIQRNWLNRYNRLVKDYNIELIKSVEHGFVTAKCNKCNDVFSLSESVFYLRLRNKICYCPLCTLKMHVIKSNKEQELYNYIKEIYTGTVLTNERKTLNGKEIDIYLPELRMRADLKNQLKKLNKQS